MTNRSAHATIKGYFYQFDHTIVRLLEASSAKSSVVVEGIEDIDIDDGDERTFVQCKYYEGSEYNHSVVKEAVILMLKHFVAANCLVNEKFSYRVYGHYKAGQEKLSTSFDLDFLKKNFLTYKHDGTTHEVHSELKVSDTDLIRFKNLLVMDIHAPSYDKQQEQVIALLVSQIAGCTSEDAKVFYYPNAINEIQKLAIQSDTDKRTITKANFLSAVNRKEIIFSVWLSQKFGHDYYAKLIKRKHFKFTSSKIPKASRIFVVDMANEFDLSKAVSLLAKISSAYSHVEHARTPPQDRFCPYVLLRGLASQELISLKESLWEQGITFEDGYPFNGSAFSPRLLASDPTKENLIRLKFIPAEEQIPPVISAITGSVVEIYDFFKDSPLDAGYAPKRVACHAIKVDNTYFIKEVL